MPQPRKHLEGLMCPNPAVAAGISACPGKSKQISVLYTASCMSAGVAPCRVQQADRVVLPEFEPHPPPPPPPCRRPAKDGSESSAAKRAQDHDVGIIVAISLHSGMTTRLQPYVILVSSSTAPVWLCLSILKLVKFGGRYQGLCWLNK